jgi:hypothetical protein
VRDLGTAGLTRAQVVTGFLGSLAMYNLAINSYYRVLLHRGPTGDELQSWDAQRNPIQTAPMDVLTVFLVSGEYLADVSAQIPKTG